MAKLLALLRAVNVGGRKLPMADLRALAAELGWTGVETYIQSGNLVFAATGKPAEMETELEDSIRVRFGLEVPTIIRSSRSWTALLEANPFRDAAEREPNLLQLLLSKRPLAAEAADRLTERARNGESVRQAGGALWLHYPDGIAGSKLTPALIDKAAGSPATGRNWRTALKLREMMEE